MPTIKTGNLANSIDRNAQSADRVRRNWQRLNKWLSALILTTTGTTGNATLNGSTLNIPVYQGQLTLTTTGNTGAATLGNNTLNIPQYSSGNLTLTTTGTSGNATYGNSTLNIPNYSISLLSTGGLAGNTTPLNLYHKGKQVVSSDPGSPADGDEWYNSTAKSHRIQQAGQTIGESGLIYANTADSGAVTNTTSVTVFSGVSATIPANFLTVGKVLRLTLECNFNVVSGSNVTVEARLGGVNIGGAVMVSTATGTGNRLFADQQFVCRSVGTNGTVQRSGYAITETGQGATPNTQTLQLLGGSVFSGINTTGTLTFDATAQWTVASTSNSISLVQFLLEVLNN